MFKDPGAQLTGRGMDGQLDLGVWEKSLTCRAYLKVLINSMKIFLDGKLVKLKPCKACSMRHQPLMATSRLGTHQQLLICLICSR